jgi:hypothetical protein
MTDSVCLEDAEAVQWKQGNTSRGGSCDQTGTVFNILHAFDLQLHKICTQNLLSASSYLGATATIVLPFQVEPELVLCESFLEQTICSVNLYVVLKKVFKTKDKLVRSQMTVKVSNGIRKSTTKTEYTSFQKHSTYNECTGNFKQEYYNGSRASAEPPSKKKLKNILNLQDEDGEFL